MPESKNHVDLSSIIPTEQINPNTTGIDLLSTEAMLTLINQEDQQVPLAIQAAIPAIATIVDKVVQAFETGGHLYYIGAGTSGRLGVLDASECLPTFNVDPRLVQGIIAGGDKALRHPIEGAEDSAEDGRQIILEKNLTPQDVLIGISASGGATYVVSALETAKEQGAYTGAITCNSESALAQTADTPIVVNVGPEVIAGSSRMKAGTAQKLILNMITTGAMIQWGKTYQNLMVDVRPSNKKLRQRAVRLVMLLSGATEDAAQDALKKASGLVKPATVMLTHHVSCEEANSLLTKHHGRLRAVLEREETS